jgi:prepilin-type N-terminal cleavage/methylation domain-containing protein
MRPASVVRPKQAESANGRPTTRRGLTLVEVLITVAVLGILAAILVPLFTSDVPDRLRAAGQIVSTDLDYARALAVTHGSKYRVTFDPPANAYYLRHSGANPLYHVLPPSPLKLGDDPPDRQTTDLAELPLPHPRVRLVGAVHSGSTVAAAEDVEFTALGSTTSQNPTVVWLVCGQGESNRFLPVVVDPVTGLAEIGPVQAELPSAVAAFVHSGTIP